MITHFLTILKMRPTHYTDRQIKRFEAISKFEQKESAFYYIELAHLEILTNLLTAQKRNLKEPKEGKLQSLLHK